MGVAVADCADHQSAHPFPVIPPDHLLLTTGQQQGQAVVTQPSSSVYLNSFHITHMGQAGLRIRGLRGIRIRLSKLGPGPFISFN